MCVEKWTLKNNKLVQKSFAFMCNILCDYEKKCQQILLKCKFKFVWA